MKLAQPLPMDDTSADNLGQLHECGEQLVAAREPELAALAEALAQRPPG